jgi:hypothetical protein
MFHSDKALAPAVVLFSGSVFGYLAYIGNHLPRTHPLAVQQQTNRPPLRTETLNSPHPLHSLHDPPRAVRAVQLFCVGARE